MSKSKCKKQLSLGALLEVEMSKKVHAVAARTTRRSQNVKTSTCSHHVAPLSDVEALFWLAGVRDSAPCPRPAKRQGFVPVSKTWDI